MTPERLLDDLGFRLERRATGGESGGAWFATDAQGGRVVLKWFPDEGVANRYALLLPALDRLRSRGVPVPEYLLVRALDGWTISAQRALPGGSYDRWPPRLIDRVIECVMAAHDAGGPLPAPMFRPWGESVAQILTVGEAEWARHDSLRTHSDRACRILDRVTSIGTAADPEWFPSGGLVHFDLHTDNVLAGDDGTLTGIIDWESACEGDHRYDLVAIAFDLDGHGQQIWDRVEPLMERRVLRAYATHMALRRTDWAIRHRPSDIRRQLSRAERVLARFGG